MSFPSNNNFLIMLIEPLRTWFFEPWLIHWPSSFSENPLFTLTENSVRKFQMGCYTGKSIMCSLETDKQTLVKNGGKFQNYDPLNRVKYWKEGDHKKIVRKPILLFSTWRNGKNGHLESRAILTTIEKVPRKLKSHKMASGNVIYGRSYSFENVTQIKEIIEIKTWICWDFLI